METVTVVFLITNRLNGDRKQRGFPPAETTWAQCHVPLGASGGKKTQPFACWGNMSSCLI